MTKKKAHKPGSATIALNKRARHEYFIEEEFEAGLARFALQNAGTLEELDINPLIVCEQGKGAWIADALLITRKEQA